MNMNLTEGILAETYQRTERVTGYDPRTALGFKAMLSNVDAFKTYVRTLSEGLDPVSKTHFFQVARNTRQRMLAENASPQVATYETHIFPILRNFLPKNIANDIVNVVPIDRPETIFLFVKNHFSKVNASDSTTAAYSGYVHEFPVVDADISRGPKFGGVVDGVTTTQDASTGAVTNILEDMGIDSSMPSHIEKTFKFTGILDSTGGFTSLLFAPAVDGEFAVNVVHDNNDTDFISGRIDYENGVLYINAGLEGNTSALRYEATASLEQNSINPTMRMTTEKITLRVKERKISMEWTPEFEQDSRALYDINVQANLINAAGDQVALDINKEIITDLFTLNNTRNPSTHTQTFYKIEKDSYTHGQKAWYETILVKLGELSATIANSTLMGAGNTIVANPLDAAIFESLNGFEYLGDSVAGGDVGYRSATVASGKYKVITSSLVTQGKMLMKYRSNDVQKAAYVYAPYVPAMVIPYPMGPIPTLTLMSRYATKEIRPKALAVLNIDNGQDPS